MLKKILTVFLYNISNITPTFLYNFLKQYHYLLSVIYKLNPFINFHFMYNIPLYCINQMGTNQPPLIKFFYLLAASFNAASRAACHSSLAALNSSVFIGLASNFWPFHLSADTPNGEKGDSYGCTFDAT